MKLEKMIIRRLEDISATSYKVSPVQPSFYSWWPLFLLPGIILGALGGIWGLIIILGDHIFHISHPNT